MTPVNFSDPEFNTQVEGLRARHAAAANMGRLAVTDEARKAQEAQEKLQRLTILAREVAVAAAENPDTADKSIEFYQLEPKSRFHSFMNNKGKLEHTPAGEGWIVSRSNKTKLAPRPNLTNNSGLGLALLKDGTLCTYIKGGVVSKEPKGFVAPRDPRYDVSIKKGVNQIGKPSADRPTILMPLQDPANQLATPQVINQAYDALARFVQTENL